MNHWDPNLVQVHHKTAKSFTNRGYLQYIGYNPEGLITQLNCPEVFFSDQCHVLVEPALKIILDNFVPEAKILLLSQNRGKTVLWKKTDVLEKMAQTFSLTLIESENNCVRLFFEDLLFVEKYINQFQAEGSALHGSYLPIMSTNRQRIYCSLLDDSISFRLVNLFAGAKLLADRQIQFRVNFNKRCFVMDQENFNLAKDTTFGLSQAKIIRQDKLGLLLSKRIEAKKKSKPYERFLELD